jgi:3-polyprenyl-4-hydroxybenzoate decarboxylase
MLLIPAFRRQRQVDLCEFQASLIYTVNSRTARAIQRNPVSKKKKKERKKERKKQFLKCKKRNVFGSLASSSFLTQKMCHWFCSLIYPDRVQVSQLE